MSTEYDGSTPLKYPKQEQFCHEYIVDLVGARAARDSGYTPESADVTASRLLRNAKVEKRIEYLKKQNVKRVSNVGELEISADRVLQEVAKIAYSNVLDFITVTDDGQAFVDLSRATSIQLAAISSIEVVDMPPVTMIGADGDEMKRQVMKVKLKMWDKVKSLELLMKHLGLAKETVEIEGLSELVARAQKGRDRVARRKLEREQRKLSDNAK